MVGGKLFKNVKNKVKWILVTRFEFLKLNANEPSKGDRRKRIMAAWGCGSDENAFTHDEIGFGIESRSMGGTLTNFPRRCYATA